MNKKEEYWVTRDGRRIAVGDMEPEHLRNALRMVLRKTRKKALREPSFGDEFFEDCTPDNYQSVSDLRRTYGDRLELTGSSVAGIEGVRTSVDGKFLGWYGGVSHD